jgi:hypothetical protein
MMEPLAVDLLLLRSLQTTELRLTPGRALMARVMRTDESGHGALNIAGAVLEAELPKHVRAGQDVRLIVREVTDNRVMLSLAPEMAIPQPPPAAVPLPGGGRIRIDEHEHRAGAPPGSDGTHTLTLQYDAPALGQVDLRFELDPGNLSLTVTLAAGRPYEQADANATRLRQSLEDNLDRAVTVNVAPRREPLDLYA